MTLWYEPFKQRLLHFCVALQKKSGFGQLYHGRCTKMSGNTDLGSSTGDTTSGGTTMPPMPSVPGVPQAVELVRKTSGRPRLPSRNRNAVQFSGQVLASGLESLKNAPRTMSTGSGAYTVADLGQSWSFTDPDKPENITFSEDGAIRAATFAKLVEKLTGPKSFCVGACLYLSSLLCHHTEQGLFSSASFIFYPKEHH